MKPEDILTADDISELTGWDKQKVWRWVREDRIPIVRRIGQTILFSRRDIVKWAADEEIELCEKVEVA